LNEIKWIRTGSRIAKRTQKAETENRLEGETGSEPDLARMAKKTHRAAAENDIHVAFFAGYGSVRLEEL
jgi:hypothetical protein